MNSQAFCTLINAVHAAQGHPERRAEATHAPMPPQSRHAADFDWSARLREKNFNTVQVGPHEMHLGHCAERVPDHLMIHVPIGICFDDPGLMLNLMRFNATTQATNLGMGDFDQQGEAASGHGNGSETDNASEHSSHGHPMSEDESSEAVLETPPRSPRPH
jgi:hypothetical protein